MTRDKLINWLTRRTADESQHEAADMLQRDGKELARLRAELAECKLSLAAIHAMAHRVSAWTIQRECERAVPELAALAAKGDE